MRVCRFRLFMSEFLKCDKRLVRVRSGSPEHTVSRTLQIFLNRSARKAVRPKRLHRNPIILALEWEQMLDSGEMASQADLARHLRVSRARVTQVLRLLRLNPDVLRSLAALGDPLPSPIITERQLRPLVDRPANEQRLWMQQLGPLPLAQISSECSETPDFVGPTYCWRHRSE